MWYLKGITFYTPKKTFVKNIFGKAVAQVDGAYSIIEWNCPYYIEA